MYFRRFVTFSFLRYRTHIMQHFNIYVSIQYICKYFVLHYSCCFVVYIVCCIVTNLALWLQHTNKVYLSLLTSLQLLAGMRNCVHEYYSIGDF